jgi:hypothetical protein
MLSYIFYTFLALILFIVLINFLRKLHWDSIHFNLLTLADEIEGEVYRRNFMARPVFHGKYKGIELTINFSSERTGNGRSNYIDISFNQKVVHPFTISSLSWLRERKDASLAEYQSIEISGEKKYGVRKGASMLYSKKIISYIQKLDPFNFIFAGGTGVLMEIQCKNIAIATKHPNLKNRIEVLYTFLKALD